MDIGKWYDYPDLEMQNLQFIFVGIVINPYDFNNLYMMIHEN